MCNGNRMGHRKHPNTDFVKKIKNGIARTEICNKQFNFTPGFCHLISQDPYGKWNCNLEILVVFAGHLPHGGVSISF